MPRSQRIKRQNEISEVIVRDPLYGFVALNPIEIKLLETSMMQRLTRIKQLGHTYIVYPSAVHTRFEHSLGVLHIASRICARLGTPEEETLAIRSAALLHDIGHGPFSHVFEAILGECTSGRYSHEDVTCLIVEKAAPISRILGTMKKSALEILRGQKVGACRDVISGRLDADKLDYLRRDSYHTGVAYGNFDIERVLHSVCRIRTPERDYFGLTEKGKDAMEDYRLARYLMHANVYEHHTRLIADDMFLRAAQIALREKWIDKNLLNPDKNVERFLKFYLTLDDHAIEQLLMGKARGTAKMLIQGVRNRNLFKRAYLAEINEKSIRDITKRSRILDMNKEKVKQSEEEIASKVGIESDQVIVHLQNIKIRLYERFESLRQWGGESPILIRSRVGEIRSLDEESPISALQNINRLYVFSPRCYKKEVKKAAENVFEVPSMFVPD